MGKTMFDILKNTFSEEQRGELYGLIGAIIHGDSTWKNEREKLLASLNEEQKDVANYMINKVVKDRKKYWKGNR